ncbi:MAG: hypothetical protein PHW74_13340 [Desulfobacca sp.]|nr:hypothetical protein [Desulfobacca sp.]
MQASEILRVMDIGNSVAEFDHHLQVYFLETQIYLDFVNGKYDIISGDKGTGKTAIYKIIKERYREIPQLNTVELIAGFNDTGNPIFQRLSEVEALTEGQYSTVWKTYFLSLIGNFLLDVCEGEYTENMQKLDRVLESLDLRTADPNAGTVFSQLSNLIRRLMQLKSAEVTFSVTEAGMPVIIPKLQFGDITQHEVSGIKIIYNEEALELLNKAIADLEITIWVVLDRLDEAFVGFPQIETPVLRALFRTYLDLQIYEMLKLKLFVRNDLFRKVVQGGFVNLTHINAMRVQLSWNPDDLFSLLMRRIQQKREFMEYIDIENKTSEMNLFSRLFPDQVDVGEKKPKTWNWMMSRIRDGNNIMPPRNLIDLVNKSREAQARREERAPREFSRNIPLIEGDSIRKGLDALSSQRVEDTLLAESGEYALYIEKFRNSKAEHNYDTLSSTLQAPEDEVSRIIKELKLLGFLEPVGDTYKIPMLFRSGLNITQGKAFA